MKNHNINFKISFYFLIVVFIFLFSFLNFNIVLGAELFFQPKIQEIKIGDFFQVDLFLDVQGEEDKSSSSLYTGAQEDEEINAIEGKIIFPGNLLEIKEILDGDSIINFWTEKAYLENNEIIFSGIILGGFKGVLSPYYQGYKPGKILSLIFKTKSIGENLINLKDVKVLLNDGLGTPTKVLISTFQFKITKEAPHIAGLLPIRDPDPPEPFELIIAQDPNVFNGKWFLVFATQDKGSGIDYYVIHESTQKKETARINTKDWVGAESPYLLKDQRLRNYIYVKVVDKAGNERMAMLSPQNPFLWYENSLFWIIIIIGILLIYLVRRILWRRHMK